MAHLPLPLPLRLCSPAAARVWRTLLHSRSALSPWYATWMPAILAVLQGRTCLVDGVNGSSRSSRRLLYNELGGVLSASGLLFAGRWGLHAFLTLGFRTCT